MLELLLVTMSVMFLFLGVVSLKWNTSISGFANAGEVVTVTGPVGITANPASVTIAQPATLTTHTTNTTGTITMTNSGHGITTGQRVDLYWTGGQCYGAVVGTVSGNTVPIASVSGGSNLPASSTAIIVAPTVSCAFNCTGNNLQGFIVSSPQLSYFVFNSGSGDLYAALVSGGFVSGWKLGNTSANPLAGDTVTTVYMSHNNTTQAVSGMQVAAVSN